LTTEDPIVGLVVVVPGVAPPARVEDLVGEVLSSNSKGSSSSPCVQCVVISEESGARVVSGILGLGGSFN